MVEPVDGLMKRIRASYKGWCGDCDKTSRSSVLPPGIVHILCRSELPQVCVGPLWRCKRRIMCVAMGT